MGSLLWLRELPARLVSQGKNGNLVPDMSSNVPFLKQMLDDDFILLEEVPEREIVFGMIGQFWKIQPQCIKAHSPEE
jgi:hypothetical protein